MTLSYALAPSPTLQLTDNAGNWVPYGSVLTLDWDTRQPKPTYYDPGGISARPNPFPLDSVGRAFEVYWETTGSYFLLLANQQGQTIWTTAYPYIAGSAGSGPITTFVGFTNLFINGQMRFFPVPEYSPIPNGTTLIAEGGWDFIKTGTNSTDKLQFVLFTPDNTSVDASPTYFLNYESIAAGTGETQKDLTFSFQDVRTLANEQVTVSLSLRSALLGTYPVEIFATQFFGTASMSVTPSASVITPITTLTPTTVATQYTGTITLPNLIGKTIGTNGDDALIITFRMPLNTNANLEMTDFYFKRGGAALEYPYESYAEVDATVKSLNLPNPQPTTDFPNPLLPPFYIDQSYDVITLVPNDGLLLQEWAPPIPTGSMMSWPSDIIPDGYVAAAGQSLVVYGQYHRLFLVPFSVGTFGTAYGAAADNTNSIQPFAASATQFYIENTTGGVPFSPWGENTTGFTYLQNTIGHAPAVSSFEESSISYTITNLTVGFVVNPVGNSSAVTIVINSLGSVSTPAQWTFTAVAASSIVGGTAITWEVPPASSAASRFYIYFVKDGVGADPLIAGFTGYACNIVSSNSIPEIATIIKNALIGAESGSFIALPAASLMPGNSFFIANTTTLFQPYYQINGSITKPPLITGTLVPISILGTDTADIVAAKTAAAFAPLLFKMPDWRGYFMRFTDNGAGVDPDANSRSNRGDGTTGDFPGTYETEAVQNLGNIVSASGGSSIGFSASSGPFVIYQEPTGPETRPINVYFTAIVKY